MKILLCFLVFLSTLQAKEQIGIYAVHMPSNSVLIDENSDQSFIPASCLKTLTTGAALHLLGPNSYFETDLAYDGEIIEGVLKGNLYIVGGGDPCLASVRVGSSIESVMERWSQGFQALGIHTIEGKVIGDDSRWENALAVPSWLWEDLGNYYGAGASALSFHENSYRITFKPGTKLGEKAEILKIEPSFSSLVCINEVTIGAEGSGDRASIYGTEFSKHQYVRGTIPLGASEVSIRGAIPDPALMAAELFEKRLLKSGVVIKKTEKPFLEKKKFYTISSPLLHEIIYHTNQTSVNLYAEHLLKKMGEVAFKEGSTESGIKALLKFWQEKNLHMEGLFLADGSGLSRKNLITPKQFVSVLEIMKKSDHFSYFLTSLPDVYKGIRAKSGSMSQIRGYVGYLDDIAFAILINHGLDSKKVKEKITGFFDLLIEKNISLKN